MITAPKRKSVVFATLGICLVAVAVALNVSWIVINWREGLLLALGLILFPLVIAGLVLNTIFLVREVRRSEQHDAFINAVTHELKTPVASLKLYLETLEYREVPEERRSEFYKTMRQDIERLNTTINNVLNAAMYTDRPVAAPRPLDLARLARRAAELTLTRHQLAKGAIQYDGPESLRVAGDAQALETALLNLLDNAVKYSKEKVQVELEVWGDADGQAHVRVRDHGIGMSRTHLPFIFTRFYRIGAEVRRSRTGTGLGLFIVRAIVKGHKGSIAVDSPGPDRGSTFTITLPGLLEAEAESDGAPEAARA